VLVQMTSPFSTSMAKMLSETPASMAISRDRWECTVADNSGGNRLCIWQGLIG